MNNMQNYNELIKNAGLNVSQKRFCKMPVKKNIRLLAPAGAGKTFSLLCRCKYIVNEAEKKNDITPHFLIISFTRSARLELEKRIKEDESFHDIKATIRTLNSWGWEQIKKPGKELISSKKAKANLVLHDLQPVLKKYPNIQNITKGPSKISKAADIIEFMDLLKSLGFTHTMTQNDYKANVKVLKDLGLQSILEDGYETLYALEGIQAEPEKMKQTRVKEYFEFWKKAVVYLDSVGRYTFEDQKYWARMFFEKQILDKKYPSANSRYTHIMVDEFQDINPLDMALLNAASLYHGIKGKKTSITVLGDDDQAIFGWRGSTPKYILHPENYFNVDFTTAVLDTNYRSPKDIVALSNKLLSYNKDREPKEMKSGSKGRARIKVIRTKKVVSSIDSTVKTLKTLLNDEKCSSIALIGRKQTTLFPYQILLSSDGISYYVDYDIDIFEGEAMQSLQAIIQTVYRAKDNDVDNPINSIISILEKIDRYSMTSKERDEISSYLLDSKGATFDEVLEKLKAYPVNIKKNISAIEAYEIIKELVDSKTVYDFMGLVLTKLGGLEKDYTKKEIDNHYKEPQFFRLKEISKKYGEDFRQFYRDIELARANVEKSRIRSKDESEKAYDEIAGIRIHLMTATRSKGHEYDAVIVLDADDDVWPNRLSDDIEEERRLFYVALSRAKKYLYFITSDDRLESRFLLETRLI